ncbi:heat shock protein 70 family protein [Tanacetum coccineum]
MGDEATQSLVLIDVTPLSLGVGCEGDVLEVLIPRNSPIPIKKETELHTVIDYQTSMHLPVFQGERLKSSENILLGEFSLSGLPLAPTRGVKVRVCYEMDVNGILNVSAREITTGSNNAIHITNTSSVSKEEIEKMIEC